MPTEVANKTEVRLQPLAERNLVSAMNILLRHMPIDVEEPFVYPHGMKVDVKQVLSEFVDISCANTHDSQMYRNGLHNYVNCLADIYLGKGFSVEVEPVDEDTIVLRVFIDGTSVGE